ncbi:phosphatidylglycerol:prolipoprotein diacylglycerol transferase [Loktanella fryxellensis]|uniref:Phosphatidylglycerol--prolipoprotein diacylglyceryl transferase n=1 Tax=Loktanella fryxellensis TaxID=245187 RepID=A0A1H8D920_9RHOB|nr:prolipoprotein diacylglyceryl transferase [Loktanella fryxellensis]SEN03656.1 phosphatidylglycerol:prolipoprotein diacylglycerol transferase [Loktanella fryxellensis]
MLAAITFPDISPEIFSVTLFGATFALRWYALSYIVGIAIGYRMIAGALRRPTLWRGDVAPLAPARLEDYLTYIVIGVIVGGRLGYCLFYQPAYYIANPLEIPAIWTGGMSFHGGFIGVVLAVYLFARRNAVPLGSLADVTALAATPAILLVRIANFVNGELWGRPTDLPWGVVFPGEAAQDCINVVGLCARHPSQLYEALLEGLVLGAVLLWLAYRRGALKSPWLLTGVFCAGYAMARFMVEFVRQPDAQFQNKDNPLGWALDFDTWGLTMGQCLSLPMALVGVGLVVWSRRR